MRKSSVTSVGQRLVVAGDQRRDEGVGVAGPVPGRGPDRGAYGVGAREHVRAPGSDLGVPHGAQHRGQVVTVGRLQPSHAVHRVAPGDLPPRLVTDDQHRCGDTSVSPRTVQVDPSARRIAKGPWSPSRTTASAVARSSR